jgi:hypothetical protein
MRSQLKKPLCRPCTYIDVALGTAVQQIAAIAWYLAYKCGIDPEQFIQRVFFDWRSKLNSDIDQGALNLEIDVPFGPEELIEATLPDSDALAKAEDAGVLWVVPEAFFRNPRAIAEKMGAGGNPRCGLLFALLNTRNIRRKLRRVIQVAIDHHRHDLLPFAGTEQANVPVRVAIKLQFSAVGGMGSGAMQYFLGPDGIRSCARESGVDASLIVQVTCRGNLELKDNEKADLNELIALKHLLVSNSGAYVSPHSGAICEIPQDILLLFSNQNCHGDVTQFERVIAHQGHCDHFLFQTLGGARMRELLVDIQDSEYTPYGEPLFAKTMACACISRDSDRLLIFLKYMAASDLAETVGSAGDPEHVQQLAVGLARQSRIVESDQENQATGDLMHPEEWGNEDVAETAKGSFIARCRTGYGLGKAITADGALKTIRNNDILHVYTPLMSQQAQKRRETTIGLVEEQLQRTMRTEQGFREGPELVRGLKIIAEQSVQSLIEKISELQESLAPHDEILGEASERVEALGQRNWLVRAASHLLAQRIASTNVESGRIAIDYQLQIAACEIATSDLLTPLIDYLDNKLQWLCNVEDKLRQTQQICENKAQKKASESTLHSVPLGLELTTEQYLRRCYADFVASKGGKEAFHALLLNEFLQRHGSLAFLTDAPLEEYEQAFTGVCEGIFRPQIENTDVVGEIIRLFSTKAKQRRLFDRIIRQCEGSFLTTGEVDQPVVWIKTGHAPSSEHVAWLKDILETTDKKSGPWEIFPRNNPDRIELAQLRGAISVQAHLRRIALPDNPESWKILVEHAPDPVAVLTVPPNPNARQFRRVLAKGIATGQIQVREDGMFIFHSSSGELRPLGKDFESADRALRCRWSELIFIESTFGRDLVIDEDRIMAMLRSMSKQTLGESGEDPRIALIDPQTVEEARIQAELLLSRLRRIRKANESRVSQWHTTEG